MSEEGSVAEVVVQKLDNHLGDNFPKLFRDHNEHGVVGTILLETAKIMPYMYGEYSDMTPILTKSLKAIESGIDASTSIGGKGLKTILQRHIKVEQVAPMMPEKKGMFGGLDGLVNGQRRNLDASNEINTLGRV